jgi:hypothetical protein
LARRLRIGRCNWPTRVAAHAVLAVAVATAHVAIVRSTGLMGDFGLFSSLSFNQISGNVFIYFALLARRMGATFTHGTGKRRRGCTARGRDCTLTRRSACSPGLSSCSHHRAATRLVPKM